ncbi:unnamed protein product [Amoebophrya sp. A120]|nr:unnamed protein product [Amoebophrya sp. A120]|eukprot:GSA120T00022499001.1
MSTSESECELYTKGGEIKTLWDLLQKLRRYGNKWEESANGHELIAKVSQPVIEAVEIFYNKYADRSVALRRANIVAQEMHSQGLVPVELGGCVEKESDFITLLNQMFDHPRAFCKEGFPKGDIVSDVKAAKTKYKQKRDLSYRRDFGEKLVHVLGSEQGTVVRNTADAVMTRMHVMNEAARGELQKWWSGELSRLNADQQGKITSLFNQALADDTFQRLINQAAEEFAVFSRADRDHLEGVVKNLDFNTSETLQALKKQLKKYQSEIGTSAEAVIQKMFMQVVTGELQQYRRNWITCSRPPLLRPPLLRRWTTLTLPKSRRLRPLQPLSTPSPA